MKSEFETRSWGRPEYVGGGEKTLRYEHRVPRVPLFALELDLRSRFLDLPLDPVVGDHP